MDRRFWMGGMVAALIGLSVAVFGFLVIWNPMRLSILAPGEEGYYQRALFDPSSRNIARAFGALICLFGGGITTEGLGSTFRKGYLQAASHGLWTLMGLMFLALWCLGIGLAIRNAIRGKPSGWSDWFRMRRAGIELGPLNVLPSTTPQMRRERLLFTIGFAILVFVAVSVALVH